MAEQFDVIVLGMGPGGEVAASRLLAAGRKVAVVERELIGGECAYWACIPSKTLLRPPEARSQADRALGLDWPDLAWPAVRDYRDFMIRYLDDAKQVAGYQRHGATVIKGTGRLAGPGRVEVDGQPLLADHIVVATGSDPAIPPLQGRETITTWTNREATTLTEIPARAVLLGGSAVGVELGQLLRRLGAQVTIVQSADRLVDREDPRVGELIRQALTDEGVEVRVGRRAHHAHRAGVDTVVELDDGVRLATVGVHGTALGLLPMLAGPRCCGQAGERAGGRANRPAHRGCERSAGYGYGDGADLTREPSGAMTHQTLLRPCPLVSLGLVSPAKWYSGMSL